MSLPKVGRYPVGGLVRRARRIADLSQRELAKRTGLSPSTVARIETGAITPSLAVMQRILETAGLFLVVVDRDGHVVQPMRDVADIHDGVDRRYPSHLDTILDPRLGEWWADQYGLARPPETFYRDRKRRDALRALSQWEVRVKLYRGVPPPPDPDAHDRRLAAIREAMRPRYVPPPFPTEEIEVDEWDRFCAHRTLLARRRLGHRNGSRTRVVVASGVVRRPWAGPCGVRAALSQRIRRGRMGSGAVHAGRSRRRGG